jgi:NTE family protein
MVVQIQISDLTMQIAKPDVLIEPDTGDFKAFEFSKAKELIEVGYKTAKEQLKNFDYV